MIKECLIYKYKISMIMAVYNVEKYIEEAIESVINQNLDFKRYCQIILVNDGSTDDSEAICLKYEKLYPDNIVYIKKENGGVSTARNKGLEHAEGQYVNFLDPDDKLSQDTLLTVVEFFDKNYSEIDLVNIPLYFFEAQTGEHPLNSKFNGNKIININEQFKNIVLSSSSSFIKLEKAKSFKFNEKLRYGEDAEFITKIILQKGKYGAVGSAKYFYRKRNDASSAIDNSGKTKDWYIDFLNENSFGLIKYCIEVYGTIIKYVQYLIMYDLKWRVQISSLKDSEMTESEEIEFKNDIYKILQNIDNDVILETDCKIWYKIFMLNMKHNDKLEYRLSFLNDKCDVLCNEEIIYKMQNSVLGIQVLNIQNDIITIEGYTEIPIIGYNYKIIAIVNENEICSEYVERCDKCIKVWDKPIIDRRGFKINIDIKKTNYGDIKFAIKIDNDKFRPKIWIDRNVPLYSFIDKSYYVKDKYCIVFTYNCFVVLKNNIKVRLGRKLAFAKELYKKGQGKFIVYRLIIEIMKKFNKKTIWLFMDRVDRADDNAEHLFKYANLQNDNVRKYFILDKKSSDWDRLSKIGKVVKYGSVKHKILFILCNKMISSHTADFARHQFDGKGILLRNLLDFDFIFLQHGIIKDDLSIHLNRYNTQFKMFVTSAKEEYESILNENYYYDESIVKLTGLPRYDKLINNDKKQIFIIPTWKKDVVGPIDPNTRMRIYNPKFIESDYFKIYNSLINDKKLIEYAKKYNYKILFYPHPEIYQQINDFSRNNYVKFIEHETSYQKLLTESSLLITDYSSIAFDFAYMKKPVIYYQWYENHYEKGYFDYEIMGMGEVCREYDEIINMIINYMKNECKMKEVYVNRVNRFYKYTDGNNCERVYSAIKS
ncbi:CDP-glycerol glycerophosphotransferase family protein [uncultured Clostridium sp.]|uniref:bifunctional glycosyltransferase/CDP-glycerol:glycerophosphate glycerophosphotransferase n=1 Tax=uncultured Clostridium sp. TaxID=59620 RepID=UPI0028E39A24|nr:CDP-glycerol glycerophosphotransferase family protein [uncultured Clostridium sp.]